MIRVASEGREREYRQQAMQTKSALLCPLGRAKPSRAFRLAPLAITQWLDDAIYVYGLMDISCYLFPRAKILS